MSHVMVDLETLGTKAGCAILSIGAVRFDPENDPKGLMILLPENRFHCAIELQSCLDVGLKIEGGTFYWWMNQKDAARSAIQAQRLELRDALTQFSEFFEPSKYLWGHGASFDQPILEAAYVALPFISDSTPRLPARFSNHRDTRTLFDLAKVKPKRDPNTHHNALADAEAQAIAVLLAYEKVRGA